MADKLERRQSLQTIAWFNDLQRRGLLNLDPPYQRRSVWNSTYKQFFIETILLGYPAPAVFLHEEIGSDGTANYNVVDGKQRLTAIFEFINGEFSVAGDSKLERYQGKYFSSIDEGSRKSFWTYQFLVEYLPTTDESTLNNIFDRINRNVAKLTRQELRHAKFGGNFARAAEEMTELTEQKLPSGVPHFARASRWQMKDVELVAQLLLLVESGPQAFSQDDLEEAYSLRDDEWDVEVSVREQFGETLGYLVKVFGEPALSNFSGPVRRIKNQADFYSLFGAVIKVQKSGNLPTPSDSATRLANFLVVVSDEEKRRNDDDALRYFDAARSASNDARQRNARIDIISKVLEGKLGA